jgi:hypothetical protein
MCLLQAAASVEEDDGAALLAGGVLSWGRRGAADMMASFKEHYAVRPLARWVSGVGWCVGCVCDMVAAESVARLPEQLTNCMLARCVACRGSRTPRVLVRCSHLAITTAVLLSVYLRTTIIQHLYTGQHL